MKKQQLVVDLGQLRLFSGPGANIHTDQAAAELAGFPAPNAGSAQYVQFIYEWALTELNLSARDAVGFLDLRFVSPLNAGEHVSIEPDPPEENGMSTDNFGILMKASDGAIICKGTGTLHRLPGETE